MRAGLVDDAAMPREFVTAARSGGAALKVLSVEDARARIETRFGQAGPPPDVIVDFDETLWLLNTTEEYLASLRPRFLALAVLLVVDALRPWVFLRHRDARRVYRDWIRVVACTLVMPWSLLAWRRSASALARDWTNEALVAWLQRPGCRPIRVATLGLAVLVRPILKHIDPTAELIAAGSFLTGHRIRRIGKNAWIDRASPGLVANAIVITDSEHDADILAQAGLPILLKWPEARYRPAFSDSYLPFLYTQRAKRPGENYMLYGVLLEDVVHLCLAFAWTLALPWVGALALLLLHLGFFAVYELGYHENDVLAVRHEAKPTLKRQAAAYVHRVKPALAWAVGLVLSVPGLALLWWWEPQALVTSRLGLAPGASFAVPLAIWIAYLAFARGSFWLYNRLDTSSRGMFYVVLQIVRLSGYGVLLRINLCGTLILLSLVMARWVKYIAYRDAGVTLKESQRLLQLAFLAVFFVCALPASFDGLVSWQAVAALAWLVVYAHRRVRDLGKGVRLHLAKAPAA